MLFDVKRFCGSLQKFAHRFRFTRKPSVCLLIPSEDFALNRHSRFINDSIIIYEFSLASFSIKRARFKVFSIKMQIYVADLSQLKNYGAISLTRTVQPPFEHKF